MSWLRVVECLSNRDAIAALCESLRASMALTRDLSERLTTGAARRDAVPSSSRESDERVFAAVVEEYRALRAEQAKRLEAADRVLHYLTIATAAIIGAWMSASLAPSQVSGLAMFVVLLAPSVLAPLVFTAISNELMIVRIGVYCHAVLRQTVVRVTGNGELWCWEEYNVNASRNVFFRLTGLLRRLVFLTPSVLPVVAFALARTRPYTVPEELLLGLDYILAFLTLVIVIYAVVVFAVAAKSAPAGAAVSEARSMSGPAPVD